MYKVTNLLEAPVKFKSLKGDIVFGSKETKVLEEDPNSNCFKVEKIEEIEKPKIKQKKEVK